MCVHPVICNKKNLFPLRIFSIFNDTVTIAEYCIKVLIFCFKFLLRSHAIACVNQFIVTRTQALMVHIGTFIEVGMLILHAFQICSQVLSIHYE